MSEPSDELKAFAAVKGWPVTTRDDGRLSCTGREDGVRCFAWTADPVLGPLLTIVIDVKSGLRFDVLPGPTVQPGAFEFETAKDPGGQPHFVPVRDLAPSVRTWLQTLDPTALTRLALRQDEQLAVYRETIAITFPAKDLDYTMDRFSTLVWFAALLPIGRDRASLRALIHHGLLRQTAMARGATLWLLVKEVDIGSLFAVLPSQREVPTSGGGDCWPGRIDLAGERICRFGKGGDRLSCAQRMPLSN